MRERENVQNTAALAVFALGDLEIRWDGGSVHHRIPRKAALLIAYLADNNAVIRRSTAAGLLFSDVTEQQARSNLRVVLSRLRSVVPGAIGSDREHLWIESPLTYDVRNLDAGGADAVLDSYRGDFLADAEADGAPLFDDWVTVRRQELRVQAIRTLTAASAKATTEANWDVSSRCAGRVIDLEPWNETAHRQLMTASAATSGAAAALAQFAECESVLMTQLGLPPSPETISLRDSIESNAHTQAQAPELGQTTHQSVTLPYDPTPFFGRTRELPLVSERLASGQYRLLSLVGPGGVGKTRLAAEVARQNIDKHPDGVHFIPLAEARSAPNVLTALVEAVAPSAAVSLADPTRQAAELIGDKRICLVLDNLEQVVEQVALPLGELLGRCQNLRLLVTSREPLGIRAEDVFVIGGLDVPEPGDVDVGRWPGVRLLVDRAYRANKTFNLGDEDPHEVGELCRLLEGMPLQIELVAARTASENISSLLQRLQRAEVLPGEGPRDTPDRHRTFDAVFDQSWSTLDESERAALTGLAITRGGFSTAAAAAILDTTGHEASRLARKSLVAEIGNGRFRFHELLRQSAVARLDASRRSDIEIRHAKWYLGRLADGAGSLVSGTDKEATSGLLVDLDNVRAAWATSVDRGMVNELGAAAIGFGYLLELAGHRNEVPERLLAAADAIRDGLMPAVGAYTEAFFVRVTAGLIAATTPDATVDELCDRIDTAAEGTSGGERERAWSKLHRAQSAFYRGELGRASQILDDAPSDADPSGSLDAWIMLQRGRLLSASGAFDEAVSTYREALERFEDLDDVRAQARTHSYLAPAYAEQNLVWEAFEADQAAMELSEQTGNRQRKGSLHLNVGASLVLLGAYDRARDHTAKGLAVFRETGDLLIEGYALAQHGECLLGLGDLEEGEADIVEGLRLSRAQGFTYGLLYNLPPWVRHLEARSRSGQALIAAEELTEIAEDRKAEHFVLTASALRARSLASLGRHDQALATARSTLAALRASEASRLPWPVATLLDLAAALRNHDQAAARALIADALDIQQTTARSINDPELRRSYLEDHPSSIELRRWT